MSVDGSGNYNADDDLESIEEGGLPGTSTVGTLGRRFLAQDNPTNSDYGTGTAPAEVTHTALEPSSGTTDPLNLLNIDPSFNTPRSRTPMKSHKISARSLELSFDEQGFSKTAWIMENGEPFCNHCDNNFIPGKISAKMACTNCGCGRPNDDHGELDDDFETVEASCRMAGYGEGDTAPDGSVVKTGEEEMSGDGMPPQEEARPTTSETQVSAGRRLAKTEDYLELFQKTSSDSELYYRGYEEAKAGKDLDTDLAEVSDDYFHGYQQYQNYKASPQNSAPQSLFDIKPNSNMLPRGASKTADAGMEQMILEKLNGIEQAVCGNEGCGAQAHGVFNGQCHCLPGQGCCADAQPGSCPECGASFHGHDVCGPRGCDGQWTPDDETPAEKVQDHDKWAAETNHGEFEKNSFKFNSSRRFKSNLPTDVVSKFFEN